MTMRRVRKYFLPRLARARAAEHPTIPPPAMTMSASSRGLELIMRELTMGDILGRGDTSARAHTALIIAVVTITECKNLNLLRNRNLYC